MQRKPFDYSWIVFAVLIIIVIVAYKPVMNAINTKREQSASTSTQARGKEIFYDPDTWGQENRSCAMCHTQDYVLSPGHDKVEMPDFKYVELKNLKKTYEIGIMGNRERLLNQLNRC